MCSTSGLLSADCVQSWVSASPELAGSNPAAVAAANLTSLLSGSENISTETENIFNETENI